jgi:ankyrin repeat protein
MPKTVMAQSKRSSSLVTAVCAFVAIGYAAYVLVESRRDKKKKTGAGAHQHAGDDVASASPTDQVLLDLFDDAIATSTLLQGLSNGDKLMLYSLYKQARFGDAPMKGPSVLNMVEYSKHSAWNRFRGMPRSTAMAHYIRGVNELRSGDSISENSSSGSDFDGPSSGMGLQPSMPVDLPDEPDVNGESLEAKLRNAAATAGLKEMKVVIEMGADLNSADDHGETALHFCADRGMLDGVAYLLELGADPNASDHDGISVLQAAVIAGHTEVCKVLLEAGADPDHQDSDGDSPRSCAIEDESAALVELFAMFHR